MHVLHVIDGLGLGGAERMLVDIANCSIRDGYRVSVCVTRKDITLKPGLDPRIDVLVLARQGRFSPSAILALARYIRRTGVDLVHVHMRSNLLFVLQLRATRLVRVPLLFHDHFGTIELDTSTPIWFRYGHRLVDFYVGVSDRLRDWARSAGMPEARTRTIPNALDLDRLRRVKRHDLRAELRVPEGVPLAIVVATIRRDKAIEVLFEAIAQLRGRVVVAIAGADGEPDYVEMIRERHHALGLDAGTVRLLGGRTDVPAILASVDLAIMPSRTESGPLVLIEYLAAGLPIVATRVGDIGHRLANAGVAGFVTPGMVGELATAIDDVLALSEGARRDRGLAGQAILLEGFDLRRVMPIWYGIYAQLTAPTSL